LRRLFTNKRGQFIVIAILFISIMIISVAVFVYSTVTYYRYQRWEEYLTIVDNIRRNSQKVLRIGLANFTQNFLEGRVRDKGEYEAYTLRGLFNSWERDLQKIYTGIGVDLEFNAVGNRLIASKWTVSDSSHIIKCFWYGSDSISSACANLSIALFSYDFYGYHTTLEEYLRLQVDTSYIDMNQSEIRSLNVIVTKENENPCFGLTNSNFEVVWFNNETDNWDEASIANVTYKESGRYILNFTNPIPKPYYKWLFISVTDQRGIVTVCSTYSYIEFTVKRETPKGRVTDDEIYTLEAGINGTWYWNGVKLHNSSASATPPPIPPIPIRLFRVNVTGSGADSNDWTIAPCQYEVWDKVEWHDRLIDVPRDLADINSPFNSSNRIVFQVGFPNSIVNQSVRIWWETDLDAPPYQGGTDLEYDSVNMVAKTNRYIVEFIGVGHTNSTDYRYPNGAIIDYHGVAALMMKKPEGSSAFCFGPWNIHGYGKCNGGSLAEWRPFGEWQIKYYYSDGRSKAPVRLIAILNSTEVQCVYDASHHSDAYYDTFAIVFITANVKYLIVNTYVYWEEVPDDYSYPYGVWFASVMGKGEPKWFAFQNQTMVFSDHYDYLPWWLDPPHEEYKYPGYWAAHWNENFGRGIIINNKSLQSLQSLLGIDRTRFSITEAMSGGGKQGSIELEAVNCLGNAYRPPAGTYYSYTVAMWMYDGGEDENGWQEIGNYYMMFLETYSPEIIIKGGG